MTFEETFLGIVFFFFANLFFSVAFRIASHEVYKMIGSQTGHLAKSCKECLE